MCFVLSESTNGVNYNDLPTTVLTTSTSLTRNVDGKYYYKVVGHTNQGCTLGGSDPSNPAYLTIDTTAPSVFLFQSSGVAVNAPVIVNFSESMNQSASQNAFSISPSVTGTWSWSGDGKSVTFSHSQTFSYATQYTVSVATSARDFSGHKFPKTWRLIYFINKPSHF